MFVSFIKEKISMFVVQRKLKGSQIKLFLIHKRFDSRNATTHWDYKSKFQDTMTRNNLILETLDTERAYCDYLNVFIEMYLKPMRDKKILDEVTIKKLFSNS